MYGRRRMHLEWLCCQLLFQVWCPLQMQQNVPSLSWAKYRTSLGLSWPQRHLEGPQYLQQVVSFRAVTLPQNLTSSELWKYELLVTMHFTSFLILTVYWQTITYYFIHSGGKLKLSFDLIVKHNQKLNCTYIASYQFKVLLDSLFLSLSLLDRVKFAFSPYLILCGWLGSKYQLTNLLTL